VLAYFHDTLATIDEHNKEADKALEHYMQAATLDPVNARYFFNCGRLHQGRYADAAKAYQALPEADRTAPEPKPEVKAALDKVNAEADGVINCWARFMGLPKNDYPADVKQKVQTALTDLYKYRNNNSDAGLQKLIDDNKAGATPVKMAPPVEQKPPTAEQKPADQGAAKPGNGQPAAAAKPATKKPKL
jgi:tetratricopeptide (TPR) repeat protein